MISIVPLIEESSRDNSKDNPRDNSRDNSKMNISDLNKNLVLRRNKPLPNHKNTLLETIIANGK